MYRNQINEIRKNIIAAVEKSRTSCKEALAMLENIKQQAADSIPADDIASDLIVSMIWEAQGDVYMNSKDVPNAEKAFSEMFFTANRAYEKDREKLRSRYGFCCYKRAHFYAFTLGCSKPSYPPKTLNEKQQKVFELAITLYKSAIGVTFKPNTPMAVADADLHSLCLNEIMIMYAAVGDFDNAIKYGKDGVEIEKAVYAKLPDSDHGFRAISRLNGLAAICMAAQKAAPAAELLQQSIEIASKHMEENPQLFKTMAARSNLTLGNCFAVMPDKTAQAEMHFKSGVRLITDANEKSDNKLMADVLTAYMMTGDYYIRIKKYAPATDHYRWAYSVAENLYATTKGPQYAKIMEKLKKYMG